MLYTKDLGTLSWREVRIFYPFMEGSVRYQRFGNPFMEGSKDLLVLDTKDLGTKGTKDG